MLAPIAYEIRPPQGVEITPRTGHGPQVSEHTDADPREFLVDLSGTSDQPIGVTVKYMACDDDGAFCKPVTQEFFIWLSDQLDG